MRGFSAVLTAFAVLLVACGGGDEEAADVTTTTSAEATTTAETTTTTEVETTTTEAEETTTTTSPYLVENLFTATRGAETSQRATATNELPVRTYERFELDDDAEVTGIEWRGIYSYCRDQDGVPDPHATAFIVELFVDGDDGPDLGAGPVYSETFDVVDTNQAMDDTVDQNCQDRPESTWSFYEYEVALNEPFSAAGNQGYWLMIQAVTPGFGTYWGWQSAVGEPSLQQFNGEFTEVVTGARAYALVRG